MNFAVSAWSSNGIRKCWRPLSATGELPIGDNIDAASHVPPVHTKTWFHTGVYLGGQRVSNFYAGLLDTHDRGEYYREPAWRDNDVEARETPARRHRAARRLDGRGGAGSLPRPERFDAAPGNLCAGRNGQSPASLHRRRTELYGPRASTPWRQPPCGLLDPRPRSHRLPL